MVFDLQLGRGRAGPKKFLGRFQLNSADRRLTTTYDKVWRAKLVPAACWSHYLDYAISRAICGRARNTV